MRLVYEGLFTLLAAYGLVALVWLLIGMVARHNARLIYAVVNADMLDEQSLRQTLASIAWIQQWGIVELHPVIATNKYDSLLSKLALQYDSQLWVMQNMSTE
ncbi:MAG: hypothetical protein FWE06_03815 [Oscillospiraceae bacterium]|nr:hypothetical protein [Oscillospiraceae bacterium]